MLSNKAPAPVFWGCAINVNMGHTSGAPGHLGLAAAGTARALAGVRGVHIERVDAVAPQLGHHVPEELEALKLVLDQWVLGKVGWVGSGWLCDFSTFVLGRGT